MQKRIGFLVAGFLFLIVFAFGNCPDKDSLWKKLVFLRDSSTASPSSQLHDLLQYEKDIQGCPYAEDSTHAFLLQRIGAAYYKLGDYIRAVQYAKQSIRLISSHLSSPVINPAQNIRNYYLLSASYEALNQINNKMEALDSIIAISIRTELVDRLCLMGLFKRVEYFYNIGDYKRCIDYISMGEYVTRQFAHGKDSVGYIFYFLTRNVWIQIIQEHFDYAKKLLANKEEECRKLGAQNHLGNIYNQLAEVEIYEKDYDKALQYYKQAIKIEELYNGQLNCKEILNNIGYKIYFDHLNDQNNAMAYFKKALRYSSKSESNKKSDSIEMISILTNMGRLYSEMRQYDSAYKCFDHAFQYFKPGIAENDLLRVSLNLFTEDKNFLYLVGLLTTKGNAYLKQYRETTKSDAAAEAIRIYKLTDQFLERVRKEQIELASKLFWRSVTQDLYENAIEACYLKGNMADAFYFFERSRAVLLNEQVKEQYGLSEKEILELNQLKKMIQRLEAEIDTTDLSTHRNNELRSAIFNQQQELDHLQQQIKLNNPIYYQNNVDTSFSNLGEIPRTVLKDHQALLELYIGENSVYSMLVLPGKIYLDKIEKKEYDAAVNKYMSFLSNPGLLNTHFAEYVKTAHHLYQLIFRDHVIPTGRIIISPSGRDNFPFESLVINEDLVDPKYFLFDHAISYTYSARYLMNDFSTGRNDPEGNFLGVAPVQYPDSFSLTSLHGSDFSLESISSLFPSTNNLFRDKATKGNFLQKFSKYSIIQLYTHAIDSGKNGEPVIYFSDSLLYLSDLIADNKPVTRLMVLSACETGNGKLYEGEGVFSFNRGFAAMGIPSSIINLWRVDDQATYRLTENFYKYLSKGLPVDVALQMAKIEFMKNGSGEKKLPYYWAAAVVVGKTEIISSHSSFLMKNFVWLILLIALIGGLLWYLRRMKKT